MDNPNGNPQWRIDVTVYHNQNEGHRLVMSTQHQGGEAMERTIGTWKGLACPLPVLVQARAVLDAAFSNHVFTRYGVNDEIDLRWSDEPEPF